MASTAIRSSCLRASALLRTRIIDLVDQRVTVTGGQTGDPNTARLANAFESFASTIQTRLDNGGGLSDGAGGSPLEQQVQRALSQVLGRSAVRGSGGFTRALNDVFPVGPGGTVSTTPSRGLASVYPPNGSASGQGYGNGYSTGAYGAGAYGTSGAGGATATGYPSGAPMGYPTAATGQGLGGSITPEQAVLYRQASRVAAEVIPVLRGIQPRSATVDLAELETLRGIVESEINSLVGEFGRLDGPRDQRVQLYLDALIGSSTATTAGHVGQFTTLVRRSDVSPTGEFTSLDEEGVEANLRLLESDARSFATFFKDYKLAVTASATQAGGGRPFAQQVIDANQLLPAVAETNRNLLAALDAIGFTAAERRITRIEVGTPQIDFDNEGGFLTTGSDEEPSQLLISDLTDWIDQFAGQQGPYLVDALGQFGLDFVVEQAATLFLIVGSILIQSAGRRAGNDHTDPRLPAELFDERVQNELLDLLSELDLLASLTTPEPAPTPQLSLTTQSR